MAEEHDAEHEGTAAEEVSEVLVSGNQGRSYERLPDGSIGPVIPGVRLVFAREDGHVVRSTTTNSVGFYRIQLSPGRYWVVATHPDYLLYSTFPGFNVITGGGYQTANFFMKKEIQLSALVLRHAEADYDADPHDPVLTNAGERRAKELVHVARKPGVDAIYATHFQRTQLTAAPLAAKLGLTVQLYQGLDVQGIVQHVLANHNGEVVVIVGHSNTAPAIVEALGASTSPMAGDEFDNLYVVTRTTDEAALVHLQYGAKSP